ncbi:Crp/Fnr family transcriptional regulator [Pedobacter hartonius]|uniref:cAMP-binding domain of CRP or a regulatory subunit of cAMP-dependent protein kinases n=1 Tax=Pedobacter hartonius TaxID=425514 RepID=A0A1H4CY49_9SPHI|nr:Crp/Fnr family transcriptional regulator [Pedobacter hartonius]SEA65250.1 cAMP-binding domain of CRP or a regulatory subunit of cAMP-dependent protein kinases [Pedobacter hartonius]
MVHHELFDFVFSSAALTELLNDHASSSEWIKNVDEILQDTKYTKGQLLLTKGQTPDKIFFLLRGAVRAYYFDDEDKQCTFYLWDEFSIVTDIVNYIEKIPSDLYIEVCEDSSMLTIPKSSLDKIISRYPESLLFLNSILLHYTRHHRERDIETQTMTANQRLNKFVKIKNKIEQKFNRESIATYLGMSRSYLNDLKGGRRR